MGGRQIKRPVVVNVLSRLVMFCRQAMCAGRSSKQHDDDADAADADDDDELRRASITHTRETSSKTYNTTAQHARAV